MMIKFPFLIILLAIIYAVFYDKRQNRKFISDSKEYINSNINNINDDIDSLDIPLSTNTYLLSKHENKLISKTKGKADIYLSELLFSNHPIFETYIESENPGLKIFIHKKIMYLFYPIKSSDNSLKFIVFERVKFVLDDLIELLTKK